MSTNPNPNVRYEQKNAELIRKITQKTIEGKVRWTRFGSKLFASLPGGLEAEFAVPTTTPIAFLRGLTAEDWTSFFVKDDSGSHLVAVGNQGVLVSALTG